MIQRLLLLILATLSLGATDFYSAGVQAIEEGSWVEAEQRMRQALPHAREARYYLGVALFEQGKLGQARLAFADYLDHDRNPREFESVFEYKLRIADRFAAGERRRLFNSNRLPRWKSGRNDALELYDEVIVTLPSHAMAAEALAGKGRLLSDMGEYVEAIENFQVLVARFPKHPKMAEGYLYIARSYLELARLQKHDPDLLALAHINLRKFRHDFATHQYLEQAEECFHQMHEVYAEGLLETGRFYERKKKPSSAAVYYRAAIRDYPDTHSAELSRERMAQIGMAQG